MARHCYLEMPLPPKNTRAEARSVTSAACRGAAEETSREDRQARERGREEGPEHSSGRPFPKGIMDGLYGPYGSTIGWLAGRQAGL